MKKFVVLKRNSEVYNLQIAYGLMVFLQALFSANGVVGADTDDFVVLENKRSAYIIRVDSNEEPDIDSYKYTSFLGTLSNQPRLSVVLFATRKMAEDYSAALIECFSNFDTVNEILHKFAYENIDDQNGECLLEKKFVLSTLDPYAIKDKRGDRAFLGVSRNTEEAGENVLLATIGALNFSRLVKLRNASGKENERIIYMLNPIRTVMNTNEVVTVQAHVPNECPEKFLRSYLSITQAQKIYDYNNYSDHEFKNVLFVAYKRAFGIRPYAVYNGFDFGFYEKLMEISPDFTRWMAKIYQKAMLEFETGAKKNAIKICSPLGQFLETQDPDYLFECIDLLKRRNMFENINERVDFRKVMEAMDNGSYSLANDKVVEKIGKNLRRKRYVPGPQASVLKKKLERIKQSDSDTLLDLLVSDLVEGAELSESEGSHLIKMATDKPVTVAKSILFRAVTGDSY